MNKDFISKRLKRLRKNQLVKLARIFGLDVNESMRKSDIIGSIINSKSEEANGFVENLGKLKGKLTITQALKVATDVLGIPSNEITNIKNKNDLLILLYEKYGINEIPDKIEEMLNYANKLKSGKIIRHIHVTTKKPLKFDEIIGRLKEYQEEYNNNNILKILIETHVKDDTLSIYIHGEYSKRYMREFNPYPHIKSKEYKPLKDLRLTIKKINETEFEVIAYYRVEENRKLGTHLLEKIFPEASIKFLHKELAKDLTEKISDAILNTDRIEALFEIFKNAKDTAKNKIHTLDLDKKEKNIILETLDTIELLGLSVNREDFSFLLESKNFGSFLDKVSTHVLTRLLKQLVSSYGKEAITIKILVNENPVAISLTKGIEGTGLSEKEYKAIELFTNAVKESL